MAKSMQASHKAPVPSLTVRDHSGGCIDTGTKYQVVGSGLIRFEDWPGFSIGQKTFEAHSVINADRRQINIVTDIQPKPFSQLLAIFAQTSAGTPLWNTGAN